MEQTRLYDFYPQLSELASENLPDRSQSVFFKTTDGRTFEGEYFGDYKAGLFESREGVFPVEDVESWHPKVCDL